MTGNYNNGIGTKDNLVIQGGSLAIAAANDGLRGQDSVTASWAGKFPSTPEATVSGPTTTRDPEKAGFPFWAGTSPSPQGRTGIQAETNLTISGGTYAITTGGGAESVGHTSGGILRQPSRQTG